MHKPKSYNRKRGRGKKQQKGVSYFKGSEIIANIILTSNTSNNPIGGTTTYFDLKPYNFGDRVIYEAALFAKFRLLRLKVTYESLATSTATGQIAIGILDDASESNFTGNILTYDQVTNLGTSLDTSVWKNKSLVWRPLDREKWYYTDTTGSDLRFTSPASLYASFSDITLSQAQKYGALRVDYVFEFSCPTPFVAVSMADKISRWTSLSIHKKIVAGRTAEIEAVKDLRDLEEKVETKASTCVCVSCHPGASHVG